jgi:hypothetical protein
MVGSVVKTDRQIASEEAEKEREREQREQIGREAEGMRA